MASVTVMTQNVCNGVDDKLAELLTATDPPKKVGEVYQAYLARNFRERASALAAVVAATTPQPHLICLQEAVRVRTQAPPDPATPATEVALDYLQMLVDALAARGLKYGVAVQSDNFDVEARSKFYFDVRHTDREVILARTDLNPARFKYSNAKQGIFGINLTIPSPPSPIGPITLRRGWVSVDVTIERTTFRLISTHLDRGPPYSPPSIQQAQVYELLNLPTDNLPVVLAGDFNAQGGEGDPVYAKVIGEHFYDAAAQVGAGGYTYHEDPDLLNPDSAVNQRIDFVFFRGLPRALSAYVVGDKPTDRTPSRFRPSDHAGVAATLEVAVTHPDRCDPIRRKISEVNADIEETNADLADPAIPESAKVALRRDLEELHRRLRQLKQDLQRCEAA